MRFAGYSEELLENNFGDSNNGMLLFWINEGTFESYLEYFIQNKGNVFKKYFSVQRGTKHFEKKRNGKDSSKSKVELAGEIAQYILNTELTIYDIAPANSSLFNKIKRLIETIKTWN